MRNRTLSRLAFLLLTAGVGCALALSGAFAEEKKEPRKPDVIYVPTPQEVVDRMLELAEVKKTDLVYDLAPSV